MRKKRQEMIIELIRKKDIENQLELTKLLKENGYEVTQATVSRDIQKLNLIKTKSNGKFKYSIVEKANSFQEKYVNIIKETFVSMNIAQNLVVYKTHSGMAMAAAAALDGLSFEEVIGTIAGDDVIFIATENEDKAMVLKNKIDILRKD